MNGTVIRKAQTLCVITAAVVATWGAGQAVATADPTTSTSPAATASGARTQPTAIAGEINSTAEEVAKVQGEFAANGVVPTVSDNGTVLRKVYSEGDGSVVTVTTQPAPAKPGVVRPNVDIGFGTGVYITLTHAEQSALLTGSTGLVVGLICAATAGIACVVAGPIVAAGVTFVNTRGLCPNNGRLEIRISYSGSISGSKCV